MKRALITGGSGDIGRAIQEKLSHLGYKVFSSSRKALDVVSEKSLSSFFESAPAFDLVINNAGDIHVGSFVDTDKKEWEKIIDINLIGTYRVSHEILSRNVNAIIINISSMSAYQFFENFSSYASSKAAVVAMTKCMAKEGIKAYVICPGSVDTKFRKKLNKNPSSHAKKHINDPDMLSPKDIAHICEEIIDEKYLVGSSILIRKNDIFEVR